MSRIGLLLPSSNTTMEPDFYTMAPPDVTIHTARMFLRDVTLDSLENMAEDALKAAKLLETADIDILLYGCTSGSLIKGRDWEKKLANTLQDSIGVPTITTSGAVIEALKTLNVSNISVFTPYIDSINGLEKAFLEDHGFHVARINGLRLRDNLEIGRISPEAIESFVLSSPFDVEAVFVSCTNLPVISVINRLEKSLGVPVVTSNQASMWAALRALGHQPVEGYGQLLMELLE